MERPKIMYLSARILREKDGVDIVNVLPSEFFEEEHIPGSVNVCVYEVAFVDKIKDIVSKKNEEVVIYGDSGNSEEAVYAAEILIREGYSKVFVLDGGIKGWKDSGFDVCSGRVVSRGLREGEYDIELSESTLDWTGRKMGKKHYGSVGLKSGRINVKGGEVRGKLVVDMEKIWNWDISNVEYNSMLIGHLKSRDFFEVDKYPEALIEIISSKVLDSGFLGDANYELTANLIIKGISREINFLASIRGEAEEIIFNSHFDIDRSEWNVKYGSEKFFAKLGMHLVSDLVSIDVILKGKLRDGI
jgi:rhodanese-related sulfurtransferase